MRTEYYLNGHKISKKTLSKMIGKDLVKRYTDDAVLLLYQDPNMAADYWLGIGMLTIRFR